MSTITKPFGDLIIKDKYGTGIYAKTQGQLELVNAIDEFDIVFVNGPAGTGKSFLSACKAVAGMDKGWYKHLTLTRPLVEAGEEMGFLPGDIDDKVAPYMRPLYDAIEKLKPKPKVEKIEYTIPQIKKPKGRFTKPTWEQQIAQDKQDKAKPDGDWWNKVEILPLAYTRGITYEKSFVIVDEAQNITKVQMKMLLTRIGEGSKLVICGDDTQSDLPSNIESGFLHAQNLLTGVNGIGVVTMTEKDIVRHKLVKDIILKYQAEGAEHFSRRGVMSNRY